MRRRERAKQLVESILKLVEKASKRKLEFGVITNIKTGEVHEVQEQMVGWVVVAFREQEKMALNAIKT